MKKLFISLMTIFLISSVLIADDKDSSRAFLEKDSQCLQFKIGSNFSLSSFSGSTISYKKHTSENRAYRIGISLSGRIRNQLYLLDHVTDSLDQRQTSDRNDLSIGLSAQFLKYLPFKHSYFYYGYGPSLSYSSTLRKSLWEYFLTGEWEAPSDETIGTVNEINIGISWLAGVEIFITRAVSIHGEYSQGLFYLYSQYKYSGNPDRDVIERISHLGLSAGGARIGCSFYF
ncbi:MAG: hypothetical protein K0B52_02200 [FCB group bacterium]|nr:hypothetical protein [FCB group bacterium]